MSVLNSWQKITRVIQGKPFGDGVNSSATVSSDPNTRATFTGTTTQNTGTAGSSAFANGDLVLLYQTQGTGAGQWEWNMVVSGGGTTSLTFQQALHYTYGTGAQIIKVPRYDVATISAHSVTAWNGSIGGIEVILAKTSIVGSGALNGDNAGFRGATTVPSSPNGGYTGEGNTGEWNLKQVSTSGNGGPGGYDYGTNNAGGGGGGGNGTVGGNRGGGNEHGATSGSADLITMLPGGGGGSGAIRSGSNGLGGKGGSVILLIGKSIVLSANVYDRGQVGGNATLDSGAGAGGAGGSVLLICGTASLGTYISAIGGAAGTPATHPTQDAGAGGTGRVAVHHSGTVTGTTSPTFEDVSDSTLFESNNFLPFLI